MRILVCGYGVIHHTGKCNCWKKSEKPVSRYVLSDELKALPPGKYNVIAHPIPGSWQRELRLKESNHEKQ